MGYWYDKDFLKKLSPMDIMLENTIKLLLQQLIEHPK